MTISRKLIGILAVSSIGLIALSASAQNANDDASRKTDAKKTSGYSWGVSQGNGYAGTQNQRKKENSTKTQERVPYQEFHIGKNTERNAPSTLPPGSNEWETPKPVIGDILQGTDIRSNGIGVDQKLGQPDYRTVKARPKANSKNRRRN